MCQYHNCGTCGLPIQEDPLARNPSKQEHFMPVGISSHTCSHSSISWSQRFTLSIGGSKTFLTTNYIIILRDPILLRAYRAIIFISILKLFSFDTKKAQVASFHRIA
jgi:hypothetical protein